VEVTLATPYKIHIDAYDGPLDLLLDLIRKQEMDIHNIPIAKITGQYLEYLHKLEELDIDVSADFIYMAATLILIKSKMLLPPDPLAGPEEQIDPREDLVHRLVEHEQFKSAAQLLHQKQQLEAHVWSKPDRSLYEGEDTQGELAVSLVDLVRVFQQVLERRKQVTKIELRHDTWTVERMMEVLRAQLLTSEEGIELAAFFESCPSRSAMICALLAVLELVRLQAIVLKQTEIFGSIVIRKHKMFEVVFAGGELSAAVKTPHSIDGSVARAESNQSNESNENNQTNESNDSNETSEPAS
jgi:segregation and condensation protein A